MNNEKCDLVHPNGKTMWSKGKMIDGQPDGYWEWYRQDGTIKRSGYFSMGKPVGDWITYDRKGQKYNSTYRGNNKTSNDD
jgi:antitoxin component YwqK of YwqJK toxin-antitoxin module